MWRPQRVSLPEGFSLLLYTDGIIEGRANPRTSERFGEARLIDAFARSAASGRETLDEILLATRGDHGGALPDDAALLLLEHQPSAAPVGNPVAVKDPAVSEMQ